MRTVGSICQRVVDTARRDEPVQVAAQRMASRCVGMLVVTTEHDEPIGIVTDRDLAMRVVAAGTSPLDLRVDEVMTRQVETMPEDASLEATLSRMRTRGVRRVPLVDEQQRLVGVVSLDDVLLQLSREMTAVGELLDCTAPARIVTS